MQSDKAEIARLRYGIQFCLGRAVVVWDLRSQESMAARQPVAKYRYGQLIRSAGLSEISCRRQVSPSVV